MNKKPINIAICYWGLTRSLKDTYKSHFEHLFNILKNDVNEFTYKTFMHTWDLNGKKQFVWEKEYNLSIDYEEWKVLELDHYKIDSQDDYLNKLNLSDYTKVYTPKKFHNHKKVYNKELHPRITINHICALESQCRVLQMVRSNEENDNIKYDFIIFIRPDALLSRSISVKDLHHINNFSKDEKKPLMTIKGDDWGGVSDKFAILRCRDAELYANRAKYIVDYKMVYGALRSEIFLKYVLEKYNFEILKCNLYFKIKRPKFR